MDSAEAHGRSTTVDVVPEVVGKGNVEFACIFGAVTVRVANERCFKLIYSVSKLCPR